MKKACSERNALGLQEADVDLDGLDWIVCHSGADIWHCQTDGEWVADEQWENLIDFRQASPVTGWQAQHAH